MDFFSDIIYRLPEYKSLEKAVADNRSSAATGLTGIHKANVITALCRHLSKKALVLVGEEQEAVQLMSDTAAMGLNALFYPIRDFSFREMTGKSREYEHKRLMVLSNVLKGNYDVVFATIDAAAQFTMPPETLKRSSYTLKVGAKAEISEIAAVLQASGYERYEQVEGEGQYAVRGGILDLFMPDEKAPFRVEFWDDEVDTINYFDVMTQRRTDYVEEIHITPSTEMLVTDKNELAEKIKKKASALRSKGAVKAKEILREEAEQLEQGILPGSIDKFITLLYGKGASLFDYFGGDSLFFVSEHTRVKERMNGYSWQFTEDMKDYVSEGVLCKGFDNFFLGYHDICARLAQSTAVYLDNFTSGSYDTPLKELINFTVKHTALWGGSVKLLMEDLEPLVTDEYTCVVLAGTQKAADSLREELSQRGLNVGADESVTFPAAGKVFVLPGAVSAGVIYPQIQFALISQGHIRSTGKKQTLKRPSNARRISELSELSNGDFVVHNTYGIGQFQGIHKIEFDGVVNLLLLSGGRKALLALC